MYLNTHPLLREHQQKMLEDSLNPHAHDHRKPALLGWKAERRNRILSGGKAYIAKRTEH